MTDSADNVLLTYCTCPDRESAERMAAELVGARLAACVNIVTGITSHYLWNEALQQESEVLMVIKTTSQKYPQLETTLQRLHPYEVPEIIATPVTLGSTDYLNWLRNTVEGKQE